MDDLIETVYALCLDCGHIEPRPLIAWTEGWSKCENCRSTIEPDKFDHLEDAEDAWEDRQSIRYQEGRL